MYELRDRQENFQDVVDSANRAIDRAQKRSLPTADKQQYLTAAVAEISQLLSSPVHRREMTKVHRALRLLPELVLR